MVNIPMVQYALRDRRKTTTLDSLPKGFTTNEGKETAKKLTRFD